MVLMNKKKIDCCDGFRNCYIEKKINFKALERQIALNFLSTTYRAPLHIDHHKECVQCILNTRKQQQKQKASNQSHRGNENKKNCNQTSHSGHILKH